MIDTLAPRSFRIGLDDSVVALAFALGGKDAFSFPEIELDYDVDRSTSTRAVWSRGRQHTNLSLAVTREGNGEFCVELALQRVRKSGVQPPQRWLGSWCDLTGGLVIGQAGERGVPGGVLRVSVPPADEAPAAQIAQRADE